MNIKHHPQTPKDQGNPAFSGGVRLEDGSRKNRIVVLSYNIHHGEGVDGRIDLERIAGVINSASPDVVSLQEVDNQTTRSNGVDQATELARLTNMNVAYGPSMDYDGGKYGNAVLTKFAIEESTTTPLPGDEPRSALCVTLKASGKQGSAFPFMFVAVHLDLDKQAQLDSVAPLEKQFDSDKKFPVILAGDLNAMPGTPTFLAFEKTWLNATVDNELFTFPTQKPARQIDHILCRPPERWKTVESKVIDESVASDHRPILAVLGLAPESGRGAQKMP